MDRRRIVAGEGLVGAEGETLGERLEAGCERRLRSLPLAEPEQRRARAHEELDPDPGAERMIDPLDELALAVMSVARFLEPALQGCQMPEAHVGSDELHSLLPGKELLLELDRPPGRLLASCMKYQPACGFRSTDCA
jgi:hypothetical protein